VAVSISPTRFRPSLHNSAFQLVALLAGQPDPIVTRVSSVPVAFIDVAPEAVGIDTRDAAELPLDSVAETLRGYASTLFEVDGRNWSCDSSFRRGGDHTGETDKSSCGNSQELGT